MLPPPCTPHDVFGRYVALSFDAPLPSSDAEEAALRRALAADALAGALVREVGTTFGTFTDEGVGAALAAARAAEESLEEGRPRRWRAARTFRAGTPDQRLRWFLAGLRGGDISAARSALTCPLEEL